MEDLKYRQMRCEEAYGKHGAVGIKIMLAIDPVLSKEDEWTLCGTQTGPMWWILTSNRDGKATCRECRLINGERMGNEADRKD